MTGDDSMKQSDIVLANVTVIDGSGAVPGFLASIVLRDEVIYDVCKGKDLCQAALKANARLIDGEHGKYVVCPGFIDMHAHSDLSLLHTPEHQAKITQGVTLEVVGQDGIGYSPTSDEYMPRIRQQISAWNGNPTNPPDFFNKWRTVKEYLDVLDASKTATNVAYLVPQGNLRMLAMGYDAQKATQEQLDQMCDILCRSMDEGGAVGMSSGLSYVPGMFADDTELAVLLEHVKQRNGYYCPHQRSYGKGALQSYAEMIQLARKTGCRLHLTHATLNYSENAGRANQLIKMLDDAQAEGLDVSLDTYPYTPSSTTLSSTLPSWAAASDDLMQLLEDKDALERIKHHALVIGTDGCYGGTLEWNTIEVSDVADESLADLYVGKTIEQIAKEHDDKDCFEMYIEILRRDKAQSGMLHHVGHEENVQTIMQHSRHCAGSDGTLTGTKPHPRGWGTFTRYVGHYGRDLPQGKSRRITGPTIESEKDLLYDDVEPRVIFKCGLEETIAHMTGRSAAVIGVQESRGLVRKGMQADLVIFEPNTISDMATFSNPRLPSRGIRSVLVNGRFALDEYKPTGVRAGRTVRRRRCNADGSYQVV